MSNVPSSPVYIQQESVQTRRPASESLLSTMAGSVNYCLDLAPVFAGKTLKYQDFTASGSFTVPEDVTMVIIEAIGGGGGGGGAFGGNYGTGGSGAIAQHLILGVTPEAVIPIIIGAAGAGVVFTVSGPTAGGDTKFNGVTVARGAPAARMGAGPQIDMSIISIPAGYTLGGSTNTSGSGGGTGGASSAQFTGGSVAAHFTGITAGGGGASTYGDGGNASILATAQDGQGYGAGGGASFNANGGYGVQGFMRISYISGF